MPEVLARRCGGKPVQTVLALVFVAVGFAAFGADWQFYGGDPGGSRFSSLDDIDRSNVTRLQQAWRYRTGDLGEGYPSAQRMSFEATPILVDGTLYFSTPYGQIHAVDAATGKAIWKFEARPPKDSRYSENTSRGVSYWSDAEAPDGHCKARIFFGTQDARMLALDALDGTPCLGFGDSGTVDLNKGTRPYEPGNYLITSPPAIWQDLLISGSAVGDNSAVDLELGIVRAIDARTGDIVWTWDPIPRDPADPAHSAWQEEQVEKTGAGNAWSPLSVDVDRGLVFVPSGSASPDYYGGERLGSDANANSVVALNAATGEVVWARQLVHHDLWDYDMPAQPVLVDLQRNGENIPAVVEITKMGMLFVLDRRDGTPVFPIEERPVPQTDVPGEKSWPTQPFSSIPPLVSHAPVTDDDAWGLMGIDRWLCQREIRRYRSEGIYTPPSLEGSINMPGYAGGGNWGSVAFDPARQYVVTNVLKLPTVVQLIPRDQFMQRARSGEHPDSEYTAQRGTPYGMRRQPILSFLGVPCVAPPWGTLAAVDLTSGEIAWQVPLGTTEDMAPWPFNNIKGVPNIGGSIVTAGGLVFIAAALDDYLRAFDIETGEELWKGRLPAGGQATPMSYKVGGKQYVVIAAGGHGGAGTTKGDYVLAFSLQ